jgi:cytosine/adenosine deaminase-related metal-dependent hydrolase
MFSRGNVDSPRRLPQCGEGCGRNGNPGLPCLYSPGKSHAQSKADIFQGKLVKVEETNASTGMVDPRDRDVASMSLGSALAAREQYHGSCNDRIHVWMAAGTPRGSPAAAHKAIGDTCENHGMGLTMHCAEAPKDLEIYRGHYASSPAEFCKANNLIGKGRKTVLAHMVNLDLTKDLAILADCEATIAHNPASNCKLASGIAAIPRMLSEGVHVSLGTDGAPCNNTYDMFQEMRLASLLQKGLHKDAKTMSADTVLEMATINGAKALGLETQVGSLEVGKKADLIVMNVDRLHCAPFDPEQLTQGGVDPVTTVVYSCTGQDVEIVAVDGQILVRDHELVHQDQATILKEARAVGKRLRECTGFNAKSNRNYV